MVGDGHAMGVAAEILQHILGATEGTSQVDDPVLSKQWPEPSSEDLGFGEELQVFGEAELPILEGLPEGRDELATEDLTQYRFGQEVVVRRADPAGVIERETSGGHHAMDMGMKPELLVPGSKISYAGLGGGAFAGPMATSAWRPSSMDAACSLRRDAPCAT